MDSSCPFGSTAPARASTRWASDAALRHLRRPRRPSVRRDRAFRAEGSGARSGGCGRRRRRRVRAGAARRRLARRGRRPRAGRACLRSRERTPSVLQRRGRSGALLVHPPGDSPPRADHARRLHRRSVARACAAAARRLRRADRLRARAAGERTAAATAVGEAKPPHLRGAARLLPRRGHEGARMTVSLVGAGPGDPELITVKGLARVRACDVLVYDRLVAAELLDETPSDALRVERDGLPQHDVNSLLVAHGRRGRRVVRLKGGDPYVFGRGGEEAVALARAGVSFEVIPGVSSLAAVPASADIPVTHRDFASAVTAFAAHDVERLDARALANAPGTP